MKLEQLKAQAYDTAVNIEALQKQLVQINQQIVNYKEPEEVTKK